MIGLQKDSGALVKFKQIPQKNALAAKGYLNAFKSVLVSIKKVIADIHPYVDGNGRIGRFIMNLMFISGGDLWTVIRSSERMKYLNSLEAASTHLDIIPFCEFVAAEMKYWGAVRKKSK